MELKHVRSFLAVARALSFSRAARVLHLSQPALSAQIQLLEQQLEATLLLRDRRKVSLTPAGVLFLRDAELLLQQVADIELRVRRVSSGEAGHLRIGFVASATLTLIPALALAFRKHSPGVTFELKNLPTVYQVEALRTGAIDAGFVRLPLSESDLTITPVAREPFAIVLPKGHRLARKAGLCPADLVHEQFVAYGERLAPLFYQRWTGLCRAAGFTPNIVQETAEMDTAIALVAVGLGVAILPEGVTKRYRKVISVTALRRERAQSEIGIAIVSARQTPLLQRLVSISKQVGKF